MTLFAFCESTKVSHKKRGQSMTPRAHEERCYSSLWGTGGSVTDHCAYFSDVISLRSPAVKLVEKYCEAFKWAPTTFPLKSKYFVIAISQTHN